MDNSEILKAKGEKVQTKKKTKQKVKKTPHFDYFEGYAGFDNSAVEGLALWASGSSKAARSDNPSIDLAKKSSPADKSKSVSSTSSCVPSSSSLNVVELRESKSRKRHKSRLRCDDPNCTPCSILENCKTCFNCLNRSKLR